MINREMKSVNVISFQDVIDEYGQKRQGQLTSVATLMMTKIYSQSNINDPLYTNVELIGITKYSSISEKNLIEISSTRYNVIKVIPSGKYYLILMRKAG